MTIDHRKLRELAEADIAAAVAEPKFRENHYPATVLALLDERDKAYIDPQGAAQVLSERIAELEAERERHVNGFVAQFDGLMRWRKEHARAEAWKAAYTTLNKLGRWMDLGDHYEHSPEFMQARDAASDARDKAQVLEQEKEPRRV